MSKYPPSLAFTLFYLGLDMAILVFFFKMSKYFPLAASGGPLPKLAQFLWDTFHIYGQVPLYFYVLHFWFLGISSGVAAFITTDFKLNLAWCVPIWWTVLSILRPLCKR